MLLANKGMRGSFTFAICNFWVTLALHIILTSCFFFITQSTSRASVTHLREMFPTRPASEIEHILSTSDTFETAVQGLLEAEPMTVSVIENDNDSERSNDGEYNAGEPSSFCMQYQSQIYSSYVSPWDTPN